MEKVGWTWGRLDLGKVRCGPCGRGRDHICRYYHEPRIRHNISRRVYDSRIAIPWTLELMKTVNQKQRGNHPGKQRHETPARMRSECYKEYDMAKLEAQCSQRIGTSHPILLPHAPKGRGSRSYRSVKEPLGDGIKERFKTNPRQHHARDTNKSA